MTRCAKCGQPVSVKARGQMLNTSPCPKGGAHVWAWDGPR